MKVRIAWATDIHLEFLTPAGLTRFVVSLAESKADAFLLGGDISHARGLAKHLRILERSLERPIFFVLGNHDYYHGHVAEIRHLARTVTATSRFLRWLPEAGATPLAGDWGLLGHDGWADGRFGNYAGSPVLLNDFRLIEDFVGISPAERLAKMQALAQEAADYLAAELPVALMRWKRVILLTHVPPFAEAAWHLGRMSNDDWLPFFASRIAGQVIRSAMEQRPDRELLVLCGHTHSPGEVSVLPNLRVVTGGARYGSPVVQLEWDLAS